MNSEAELNKKLAELEEIRKLREGIAQFFWEDEYRNWSSFSWEEEFEKASAQDKIRCFEFADSLLRTVLGKLLQ